MGNARLRAAKAGYAIRIQLNAVCVPDISPHPPQTFRIFCRGLAKAFAAIADIMVILGQMGVQHSACGTR